MMATDIYGPSIQIPVSRQKASASQFGIPVRAAIVDLDARVQDYEANQVITTGMVDQSNFTTTLHGVLLFAGPQQLAMVGLSILVGASAIVIPADGNVTDFLMTTLPAALVPNQPWYGSIGHGRNSGEVTIAANGQVTVRSWTPAQNIAAATTLKISAAYLTAE
jgi:hypothetical protein